MTRWTCCVTQIRVGWIWIFSSVMTWRQMRMRVQMITSCPCWSRSGWIYTKKSRNTFWHVLQLSRVNKRLQVSTRRMAKTSRFKMQPVVMRGAERKREREQMSNQVRRSSSGYQVRWRRQELMKTRRRERANHWCLPHEGVMLCVCDVFLLSRLILQKSKFKHSLSPTHRRSSSSGGGNNKKLCEK